MGKRALALLSIITFLSVSNATPAASAGPDWKKVPSSRVTLFYLGLASWEFLLSPDHALGGKNMNRAKSPCSRCHIDEEGKFDMLADDIAAGTFKMKKTQKPMEPEPIPGKKGFMDVSIQAAYDAEFIYLRVVWDSPGSSAKNPDLAKKGLADRASVQLNTASAHFTKYGCFISCHDDSATMPGSPSKEEVKKHPYYSAIGRDDVRLYSFNTRSGGWADLIDKKGLDGLLAEGALTDLWEVSFAGGGVEADDGWVLEDRQSDEKDDVEAGGGWSTGKYTVVFKRKLATGDKRDVELKEGGEVNISLAIHDGRMGGRKHYVSLPQTIGLGTDGDIKALKLK
jgi:cytochrome c-type protein NapC